MKTSCALISLLVAGTVAVPALPGNGENASAQTAETARNVPAKKSFAETLAAAEAGDAAAQYELGEMYREGGLVAKDEKAAFAWHKKSAESGNADGQRALGSCFILGVGTARDDVQAEFWYKKAADGGDTKALTNLVSLYTLRRDWENARIFAEKAAAAGDEEAYTALAQMHIAGYGVERDLAKAEAYLRKAEATSMRAREILDLMAREGLLKEGARKTETPRQALARLLKVFEETGDAKAARELGELYRTGAEGVPQDFEKAARFYEAAVPSDSIAEFWLAAFYELGQGVPANSAEALKHYEAAAKFEHPLAQLRLGRAYYAGTLGVKPDQGKAKDYLLRAAKNGCEEEVRCLLSAQTLVEAMRSADPDAVKKAAEAVKPWAEKGFPEAQCALAGAYFVFKELEPDQEKTKKLFEAAAEKNDGTSCAILFAFFGRRDFSPTQNKRVREETAEISDPKNLLFFCRAIAIAEGAFGYEKDIPKAVEMLKTAAEAGIAPAADLLWKIYAVGVEGVPADAKKSEYWRGISAEKDHAESEDAPAHILLKKAACGDVPAE